MPKSMQNLDKKREEITSLDVLDRKFSASSNSNKRNDDYCFDKRKKSENKENNRIVKEEFYLKILKKMELVKFIIKDNKSNYLLSIFNLYLLLVIIEPTVLPLNELTKTRISLKLGQESFRNIYITSLVNIIYFSYYKISLLPLFRSFYSQDHTTKSFEIQGKLLP